MEKLEIKLPEDVRDRFQSLCEQRGVSMSAEVRAYIMRSLPSTDGLAVNLDLSKKEWTLLTKIAKAEGLSPEAQLSAWVRRAIAARVLDR